MAPLIPASFDEEFVAGSAPRLRSSGPASHEIAPSYVFLASDDASFMTVRCCTRTGGRSWGGDAGGRARRRDRQLSVVIATRGRRDPSGDARTPARPGAPRRSSSSTTRRPTGLRGGTRARAWAPWSRCRATWAWERHDGVRSIRSPYVAFCDDDSWWAADALSRRRATWRSTVGGARRARVLGDERSVRIRCHGDGLEPLARGRPPGPRLGFLACGAVVRRDAYLDIGGFEPRFGIGGEEQLLAIVSQRPDGLVDLPRSWLITTGGHGRDSRVGGVSRRATPSAAPGSAARRRALWS